ncbi:MAG: hypothetical protein ACO396_05505, partial [Phycisphaerales bacterium]
MSTSTHRSITRRDGDTRLGRRLIAAMSLGLALAAMAVVGCRSATTPAEPVATAEAASAPRP